MDRATGVLTLRLLRISKIVLFEIEMKIIERNRFSHSDLRDLNSERFHQLWRHFEI